MNAFISKCIEANKEIYDYIKQAKKLGLKEIKILGRGEPFQNKKFLENQSGNHY